MVKKVLVTLFALILALGMLGCGDSSEIAGKDDFLGLEDGEEFVTDTEVALSFIRPSGNVAQEDWWSKTVEAFNTEYAGRIRVTSEVLVRSDSGTYEQQIGLRVEDGLPDIMYMDGPYVSNWAYNKMIIPIDNYLTKTYLSDFMPYVLDQGTYNERLYSLSIVDSTIMVFYRKSFMTQFLDTNPKFSDGMKITLPDSPENAWTFAQLAEVATKMTTALSGGKTRYGLSIAGDKSEWMSYAFSPMWGGKILGDDGLTATGNVNSAKGLAAGNYIRGLREKRAINPSAGGTDFYDDGKSDGTSSASEVKAAMYFTGTQNITKFNEFENVAADWDATYYPRNNDGTYAVPCGGWTLALSRDIAEGKRVAAVEFIKYLTSVQSCEEFARDTASPPARKALYESMDEYKDGSAVQGGAYVRIKQQILAAAQPRTKTVAYAEFSPTLAKALNEILSQNNGLVIKDKLDTAATTIDTKIRVASYK